MHNDDPEMNKMPLLDHLIELRNRMMWAFGAVGVLFLVCYYFSSDIYGFLVRPLANLVGTDSGRRMIYTGMAEAFFTYVKVSFWSAVFLAFPVIATQLWMFIAPGLYRHEKRAFLPFLVATPFMFFLGGAVAYYVIFPLAWQFFLGFESTGGDGTLPIQLEARVAEYLSIVMTLIFAFGIAFETPVLLTLLAHVGIVTAAGLRSARRFIIVGVFVIAAIVTPPDPISQITLAIPILILFELSVLLIARMERRRAAREAAEEAGESAA